MLRGHAGEPENVLVLATLGAPQRRLLRRRRGRRAEPHPDPAPVTTARVTVIDARPLQGAREAERWLARADLQAEVDAALDVLNDVLAKHRVAAADPLVREVAREHLLVARVGFGAGEEVADGRWSEAREVPPPRERNARREAVLRPQERLAALLGGRDAALACEELTLRARLDLDRGRVREAALQVRVALEAALAELQAWRDRPAVAERLQALMGEREAVAAAANRALQGGLDEGQVADVARVVERLEAALAARLADER